MPTADFPLLFRTVTAYMRRTMRWPQPVAIFDKSLLHSLNREEAAVFDVQFVSNITPLFFMETLADLEKEVRDGRTPEQVVGNLAEKTPRLRSYANLGHWHLCCGDLMGVAVEMQRRPVLNPGRAVVLPRRTGVVYEVGDEMRALHRWQKGRFEEVERLFARNWRPFVQSAPPAPPVILLNGRKARFGSLAEVLALSRRYVEEGKRWGVMRAAMDRFLFTSTQRALVLARWKALGGPPLHHFAPYAAFVLVIEVFFDLAQGAGLISQRASNRLDIAYLYYLPFTELFVSGDKLHLDTVPLFMDRQQHFAWAPDLKADLAALRRRYAADPNLEKEGLMRIAADPPLDADFLVSRIYDKLRPGWREEAARPLQSTGKVSAEVMRQIETLKAAPGVRSGRPPWDESAERPDEVLFQREVPLRCGSFRFLPFGVEADLE